MIAFTLIATSLVFAAATTAPKPIKRESLPAVASVEKAPELFIMEYSGEKSEAEPKLRKLDTLESPIPIYACAEKLSAALKKKAPTKPFAFCPGISAESAKRLLYLEAEEFAVHMLELPAMPAEKIPRITESLKAVNASPEAFLFVRYIPSNAKTVRVFFEIWERTVLFAEGSEEELTSSYVEEMVGNLKQKVAQVAEVEKEAFGEPLGSAFYIFFLCDV